MYIKVINGEMEIFPYEISNLKTDNPNVSFPTILSDELLASYDIFRVIKEDIVYDDLLEELIDGDVELLDGVWTLRKTINILPQPSEDELAEVHLQNILAHIQIELDHEAMKTGWDDMQSARACTGIPLDGNETEIELAMYNDAVSLGRWYLKVWGYVYQIQADVNNSIRLEPSIEEILINLPARQT